MLRPAPGGRSSMNAVIYARFSCENQREESIEGQVRECRWLAKSKKVCYNKAQDIVDSIIAEQVKALPNDLANLISKYASNGYKQHKYTEIIAECYSAYDSNDYAKMLLDTLEGVF